MGQSIKRLNAYNYILSWGPVTVLRKRFLNFDHVISVFVLHIKIYFRQTLTNHIMF